MSVEIPCERIASLFGPGVVAASLAGAGDPATLLPAERAATARFAHTRLAEFAAGRQCARAALAAFGFAAYALVPEADRRPRWPPGIVGSISHTSDFCGAVVARAATRASLGFDVERYGRIGRDLWPHLFVADERERLARATPQEAAWLPTVMFAAKEAFYKCRYGITGAWLDFTDVRLDVGPPNAAGLGDFTARLVIPDGRRDIDALRGRYALDADRVLCGVEIRTDATDV